MAMATETGGQHSATPGSRAHRLGGRPWYMRLLFVLACVTALAAGLRFYRLSSPPTYVFDEVYYAKDACLDAGFPYRQCGLETPAEQTFSVHPPLGRWIIAGGEAAFGNRPFGWRVAAATFGTLSVLITALLAYKLLGGVVWAGVAGLLLATESLHFVQSRISMLDIFVAAFVVAGFLFLVLDREWIRTRMTAWAGAVEGQERWPSSQLAQDRPPSPLLRPWRFAAGIAFGAAVACKWSGGFALLAAIGLAFAWERSRRKRAGLVRPLLDALREESFGILLALVIAPLLVYAASYVRWFAANGWSLGDWWEVQVGMARFSLDLDATHPYASRAWTWLVLTRPVAYFYKCTRMAGGSCLTSAEILGIGNPAIFWSGLVTIPYAFYCWVAKRRWQAGLVFVAFAGQYAPWFVFGRTSFLFYMTPVTPFLVLAATYALKDLARLRLPIGASRGPAAVAVVLVAVSVALFIFFLPVLTGRAIPQSAWQARMWFRGWI